MKQFLAPAECPKCGHDESWSVWIGEQGHPMGRCFRAQCGYLRQLDGAVALPTKKAKEPRYFTRPITHLTADQMAFFHKRFGAAELTEEVAGYSEFDDRFLLGVYGPTGYNRRGHVAYSFNAKPKTLTYNEKPDEPFIHYAKPITEAPHAHLVIVEDWFSAEKVATTGNAVGVALMGTHMSQADVTEIATTATRQGAKTWLALDRDAYQKSIGYLFRYREQFPCGLWAWSLGKDLKYETTERIQEALDGKVNFVSNAERKNYV